MRRAPCLRRQYEAEGAKAGAKAANQQLEKTMTEMKVHQAARISAELRVTALEEQVRRTRIAARRSWDGAELRGGGNHAPPRADTCVQVKELLDKQKELEDELAETQVRALETDKQLVQSGSRQFGHDPDSGCSDAGARACVQAKLAAQAEVASSQAATLDELNQFAADKAKHERDMQDMQARMEGMLAEVQALKATDERRVQELARMANLEVRWLTVAA